MPCASFEDLVIDYVELSVADRDSVDAHLANCANCREYLDLVAHIDTGLAGLYSGAQVPAAIEKAVRARAAAEARLVRPSPLPEVLDFIGAAGISAAILSLAPLLPDFRPQLLSIAAAVAIGAAIWAGVRSYADLKY